MEATVSRSVDEGDDIARSIADYERLSGILWIGLGAIQIIAVVTAIAGAWNIWAGISRLSMSKRVRAREVAVPPAYEGLTQLVVIGLVNLIVGGVIGLVFVGLDLFIRERVLDQPLGVHRRGAARCAVRRRTPVGARAAWPASGVRRAHRRGVRKREGESAGRLGPA